MPFKKGDAQTLKWAQIGAQTKKELGITFTFTKEHCSKGGRISQERRKLAKEIKEAR